jgi:hypothetical protein
MKTPATALPFALCRAAEAGRSAASAARAGAAIAPPWGVHSRASTLLAGVALSLALGACSAATGASGATDGAPAKPGATQTVSAADLLARIRAEIASPTCTRDSQCRSLPVGHKACGGPETHLAWSTTVSNEARLLAWAGEHAVARRKEVEARGLMSNCQVQADPGAVCRQGLCVPGGAGRAASGGADLAR